MNLFKYILMFLIILPGLLKGQNVSFNTDGSNPDPSAIVDMSDTTRGMLVPRMDLSQRNNIVNPATGLLIYQTNSDSGFYFNQGTPGSPSWERIGTASDSSLWSKNDTSIYYENGNVGIGVQDPQGPLHLYGSGSLGAGSRLVFGDDYHFDAGNNNLLLTFIGESGWDSGIDSDQLQYHSNGGHFFTTGGGTGVASLDTAFRVTNTGSVLVGDYEGFNHAVSAGKSGDLNTFVRLTSDSGQVGLWYSSNTSFYALFSDRIGGSLMPQGAIGLYGGKTQATSDLRFMIDSLGNFGLSSNNPLTPLHLEPSIIPAGPATAGTDPSGGTVIRMANDLGATLDFGMYATGTQWLQATNITDLSINNEIVLNPNGGFVGIGLEDPKAPLEISQQGGDVGMIITEDVEIGVYSGDDFEIAHVNTSGGVVNKRFTIQSDGDVIIYQDLTVNGTINPSDKRLKTDIVPINGALDKVLQLKGIYHYWDTLNFPNRSFSSERTIGLIAQDVQKVFPELISTDDDGYLGVNYTKFTAVLLQAMKEQQALIDQQNQNNEKQQYQIDFLMEELKALKMAKQTNEK